MTEWPLVSVAIPTYDRLASLQRAVASVLAQDHPAIELVICDNASTDGTEEYGLEVARAHEHVRYVRNSTNLGATANFNRSRAESRGDYLLWLGDDDTLEPGYVRACVAGLAADPGAVLAAGRVRYDHGDGEGHDGVRVSCLEATGPDRVRSYYRQVRDNGTFYGVTRRDAALAVPPMANRMGDDWYLMAGLAFQGRILAVDETTVVRAVGGATRSLRHVARGAGMSRFEGEMPQLAIAGLAWRDISWASPVYASLRRPRRMGLATDCAAIVTKRFVVPKALNQGRLQLDRLRRRAR